MIEAHILQNKGEFMNNRTLKRIVLALLLISAVIYLLQILIFHDPETTAFYIFQDFAFMPVTIAIATLMVGEVMDAQEKKSRIEKTRMLTSTFFSGVGVALSKTLFEIAEPKEEIRDILGLRCSCNTELEEAQARIQALPLHISLTGNTYNRIMEQIRGERSSLMTMASNPLLFEHEDFTELLWSLFHLMDEYQLRGSFETLSAEDLKHLNQDMEKMFRQLLLNYVANAMYLRQTYPHLYSSAKEKMNNAL